MICWDPAVHHNTPFISNEEWMCHTMADWFLFLFFTSINIANIASLGRMKCNITQKSLWLPRYIINAGTGSQSPYHIHKHTHINTLLPSLLIRLWHYVPPTMKATSPTFRLVMWDYYVRLSLYPVSLPKHHVKKRPNLNHSLHPQGDQSKRSHDWSPWFINA